MYPLHLFSTFLSLAILHIASASPVVPHSLQLRQSLCTDARWGVHPSCWSSLNLTEYITHWKQTTPVGCDDPACCKSTETWSNCFVRLATNGNDNDNCTMIGGCTSTDPGPYSVDASIAPEVAYIVHNIYTMNIFFTNWYNALTPSIVQSELISQSLITEIDPKKKTNMVLNDLLTALSAGLAFIAAPGAGLGISEAVATAGSILSNGLKQAPGVAKAIWPTGTLDTQSVQLGNIDTELVNVFSNFTNSVTDALAIVMSDVPSFIAFANNGAFSGTNPSPINQDVDALTLGLKTYVLSTAMSANGWHVGPITSVTRADIASNNAPYGFDCTFGLNGGNNNICTNSDHSISVYYSDATERAYVLSYSTSAPDLNPYTLVNDIITNKWSNPEVLFDNAFDCTVAGGTGQPLNFFENGQLDFSCMSQLQMCACGNPCPVAEVNGKCPFHCDWLCH